MRILAALFIIVAFSFVAIAPISNVGGALLFRFFGATLTLFVALRRVAAFITAEFVAASLRLAVLFTLDFLLGLHLRVFFGRLFPSGKPVLKHVLDQQLESLRCNHFVTGAVHERFKTHVDFLLLLGTSSLLRVADARLELVAHFVDQVQCRFESVFVGDLVVETKQAGEALEDDLVGQKTLTVQLTDKIDVSEKALLVPNALFIIPFLTGGWLVLGEDFQERFTALVEQLSAEVTVLDVAPHGWVALHFELESEDVSAQLSIEAAVDALTDSLSEDGRHDDVFDLGVDLHGLKALLQLLLVFQGQRRFCCLGSLDLLVKGKSLTEEHHLQLNLHLLVIVLGNLIKDSADGL